MDFNFDTGDISRIASLDTTEASPLVSQTNVLTIIGNGAITLPVGSTAQEPSPAAQGMFRFNSDITQLEYYDGTTWRQLTSSAGSVASFQTSLSGLTPQTATTGAVVLAGTLGLSSGGTSASLTPSAGSIVYSTASAMAFSTVGTSGYAFISGGTGAPTWQDVSSNLTTNPGAILEGDGTGQFVANGASFAGTAGFSGVTLNGVVTNPTDATTKAYVDNSVAGLSWKQAVTAGTVENFFTLTGTAPVYNNGASGVGATLTNAGTQAALVLDGISVTAGQRVLVKNESNVTNSSATWNGIYVVTNAGSGSTNWVLTRSTDNNTSAEMESAALYITDGATQATTAWVQSTQDPITIGTSPIVFVQFSGAGTYQAGTGLSLVGNTFNVKTDGVTTYINGSNQVAVDSSGTQYQVLTSTGTAGTTATWSAINLASTNAVTGTLAVGSGGTGDTTFTSNGVIYGNGTSPLGVTAAGTTGQVLVGNTAGAPSFSTLTSIAVTSFQTSLSGLTPSTATTGAVTLAGTLGATSGGTGSSSAPTSGQFLYSSGGTTYAPTTLASQTVTSFSGGTTGLTPSTATMGAVTLGGTLNIANGGTGSTSFTTDGVVYGGTTLGTTAAGTTGQVLVGNTGSAPTFSTLSTIAVTSFDLNDTSTTPIYTTTPTTPTTGAVASTITLNTQSANLVFAGPASGAAAQPTFRALVYNDVVGTGKALQLYSENPSSPTAPSATGTNSVAIGTGSSATGTNSFGLGNGSKAYLYGAVVNANGDFATAGDAQQGQYVVRAITTTNTANVPLYLDGAGASQRLVLPTNSGWTFNIRVVARRTDATGSNGGWAFTGVISRDSTAASTAFIGTPSKTVIGRSGGFNGDCTVVADITNGSLDVEVTGVTGNTIRWVATVETTEVTN